MPAYASAPIRVYVRDDEITEDLTGRYLLTVRVKVPRLLLVVGNEDLASSPSRLDPGGRATDGVHSDPRVGLHEVVEVLVDITDHPECPTERSTPAADAWLTAHWREVDVLLKGRV